MASSLEECIRDAYAMYGRAEIMECIDKYIAEDVTFRVVGDPQRIPWFAGEVKGRDNVKQYFLKMVEVVDPLGVEIHKIMIQEAPPTDAAAATRGATVLMNDNFRFKQSGEKVTFEAVEVSTWVESDAGWQLSSLTCHGDTAPLERATAAAEKAGAGGRAGGKQGAEAAQEVAALLDRAFEGYRSGDAEGMLAMMTDDIVFDITGDTSKFPPLFGGVVKGKEQVVQHWGVQASHFRVDEITREVTIVGKPGEAPGGGTWAMTAGYSMVTAVPTGKTGRSDFSHLLNVKDGKVVSLRVFSDIGTAEKLLDK